MESYSKVGMQEPDQRLSKIVEAARKKPVSVYRYGAPWVWIVSQEDWRGALKEVSSYIPPGHSLALLKPQIESLLAKRLKSSSALAREHGMSGPGAADPCAVAATAVRDSQRAAVVRAIELQPAVSLVRRPGDEAEDLEFSVFVGDITVLLNSAEAVRIIAGLSGSDFPGISCRCRSSPLNFALLHTWQARHGGARRLNI